MEIRGIANSATSSINDNQIIVWQQNKGYTTDATGHRTPLITNVSIKAQIQAVSAQALKHIDALNIQGVMRSVYMFGNVQGVVRADQKGGDILQFPQVKGGQVKNWLVIDVAETWPTWAHVVVVLQNP